MKKDKQGKILMRKQGEGKRKDRVSRGYSLYLLHQGKNCFSKSHKPPSPLENKGAMDLEVPGSTWPQGTELLAAEILPKSIKEEEHAAPGHQCYDECFLFSMARLVAGMGSVNSPAHTQEDWVDSNLCILELFAQFAVLLL
eukprot:1143009-Pelagomonas_calceolata.AAC.1